MNVHPSGAHVRWRWGNSEASERSRSPDAKEPPPAGGGPIGFYGDSLDS